MANKHDPSPGPWSVEDEGHMDHEGYIWVVDARGLCVAELECSSEGVIGRAEAEANADMIGACRAMAEALRVVLKDRGLSEERRRIAAVALAMANGEY